MVFARTIFGLTGVSYIFTLSFHTRNEIRKTLGIGCPTLSSDGDFRAEAGVCRGDTNSTADWHSKSEVEAKCAKHNATAINLSKLLGRLMTTYQVC